MSKKKDNRIAEIVRLIVENGKMDVAKLSDSMNVSQVTIRKDLNELEEKGIIKRSFGYAIINNADDISSRLAFHYNEKMAIAKKASSLVNDHETVIIESGSCCALLASVLANEKKDITIITNSAFISDYVRNYPSVNLILLGGIYQKDSQCTVGPALAETVRNYHVKSMFIGTDGYHPSIGFTNKDTLRARAVRDMSRSCEEVIVLTESQKFGNVGTVPLNLTTRIKAVVTDSDIAKETINSLRNSDIDIILSDSTGKK